MKKLIQYCPSRTEVDLKDIVQLPSQKLNVFDEKTVAFFAQLSRVLLSDKVYSRVPEVATLGFWLRKASIEQKYNENKNWLESPFYKVNPLGKVFHVAPSNVDTIFLYSLCISLLMGNSNIIKVSSSFSSPVVDFIIDAINKLLVEQDFNALKQYITILTYGHEEEINFYFSENVNCRVIWGGDSTVGHFKKIHTPVYVKDIVFPNRVSYAVFNASTFLKLTQEEKHNVAHNFYNDAYTFDQMGCSSPKKVYVLGDADAYGSFKDEFYIQVSKIAEERYHTQAALVSVQKYNHLIDDVIEGSIGSVKHSNNAVYLVENYEGKANAELCQAGYFYIKSIKNIDTIADEMGQEAQTLTYFGLDENVLNELSNALYGKRIDRIVPIGKALSFDYIWDGMNLFEELSRKRFIQKNTK